MHVALVNTNRMKPPIAPIGLEYVAEVLNTAGHCVEILDLCWEEDWHSAMAGFFAKRSFDLVGVTLRNTDDCFFTSRQSFLSEFADAVNAIRGHTDALIVLGGVGFSVMPEQVLSLCQADVGVWGDGEFALVELASRVEEKTEWFDLPNLIWRCDGSWQRNLPAFSSLANLPPMSRGWFDNSRYFREGAQGGIETKRGCPRHCIYCVDPIAKGKTVRTRPASAVADELERLLEQEIDHIYICDSEFNIPKWHAFEVCEEIISRGLGDKLHWYAYCSAVPFSSDLAGLMRRAGCVGINFGVDSGDERMLRRLGRDFTPDDILSTARLCREAGIAVLLDLLLGSPGETRQSIIHTIELMKQAEPDQVGITLGVRVYPGTELARLVRQEGLREGLIGGDDLSEPVFFVDPLVAPFASELINEFIGDDDRFFFLAYNTNQLLERAIRKGYRGAFWDILRRYSKVEEISIAELNHSASSPIETMVYEGDLARKWDTIRVKADLLCMGIHHSDFAAAIYCAQNPGQDWKTGNVGLHIALENGSHVLVTMSHSFDQRSPYHIEGNGDGQDLFLLRGDQVIMPIEVVPMPGWYHRKTTTGAAMPTVFLHEGRAFLHQTYLGCDYQRIGLPCKFCGTGCEWDIGTPVEIGETVAEAVSQNPQYQVCLGGGTRLPHSRNVQYFADCLTEIRKRVPGVPVWVEIVPPESDDDISRLVDAGATSFGFNIEIWDDNLRKQVCPGKSQIPKGRYLAAMRKVLTLLGPNRVGSCLLVGIQPVEDVITGAIELASMGVQPCVLPFKPWDKSEYEDHPPCTPNDLVLVSKAAVEVMKKNRIRPDENQGCLHCESCTIDHDIYELESI